MNSNTVPTTKELLLTLSTFKNVYGTGARMFMDDPHKGPAFLAEIYDDYKDHPENCVRVFGYKTTFQLFAMFKDSSALL